LKEKLVLAFKVILLTFIFCTVFLIIAGIGVFVHFSKNLPNISTLSEYRPRIVSTVYDKNNILIGEFFREKRYLVAYSKIPTQVIQAFISSEDDKFFDHKGLDFQGILRAMIINFKAGRVAQGGSTITQQVAKSLLLSPERKISRKIKEAILAFKIEKNLSKEQILYLYLNQIYLGHGAYGVQAASQAYFGKDVSEISLAEAALLAGLPQAPSRWNPFSNPDRAKERQIYVLSRMLNQKYITKDEAEFAANKRLIIKKHVNINLNQAPYFTEFVRRYLNDKYGVDRVLDEGLKVYTTLDINLQKQAQEAIKKGLLELDKRQGYKGVLKTLSTDEAILEERKNTNKQIHNQSAESVYFPEPGYKFKIRSDNFSYDIDDELEKNYKDLWEIPTPIKKGEFYKAVVLEVEDEEAFIKVGVGNIQGLINKENFSWAYPRALSADEYTWSKSINKPSEAFKKGDIVLVSYKEKLIVENEEIFTFFLEQEPEVEASILSLDIDTGYINAMVGGFNYSRSEFNRAYQSKRQAGSTFKPFVYAAALDKNFTASSVILDSPIVFSDEEAESKWKPQNYGERFYGDTLFRDALIHSRNIPSTKILEEIKIPYAIEYIKNLGIKSQMQTDLSLALGSTAVSLWEMLKAYSVFASSGKRVTPIFIKRVIDSEENILEELFKDTNSDYVMGADIINQDFKAIINKPLEENSDFDIEEFKLNLSKDRIIPEETAYIMNYILKDAVQFGTGRAIRSLNRPIAAKTGTTNQFIDAWFIGYTPQIMTGVWVGFDDNSKTLGRGESGAKAAIPIWLEYMKEAVKEIDDIDFTQPKSIKLVKIDNETGKLANQYSKKVSYIPFKQGTEPKETDATKSVEEADEIDFFRKDF